MWAMLTTLRACSGTRPASAPASARLQRSRSVPRWRCCRSARALAVRQPALSSQPPARRSQPPALRSLEHLAHAPAQLQACAWARAPWRWGARVHAPYTPTLRAGVGLQRGAQAAAALQHSAPRRGMLRKRPGRTPWCTFSAGWARAAACLAPRPSAHATRRLHALAALLPAASLSACDRSGAPERLLRGQRPGCSCASDGGRGTHIRKGVSRIEISTR